MRKICVYTSTRADYGLLRRLIKKIESSSNLNLQLLVSGTHLVPGQGMTIEEIRKDGFEADVCVDIHLMDDSPKGICHSMGRAVSEYGKFFAEHHPEILVLLGDRFETFCCATAAWVNGVPIAHIHGGEITRGAMDDAFRHGITKMAHLHFPSCEEYRRRIIQMGEQPDQVHTVGALGMENILNLTLMGKGQLGNSIGFELDKPFFLITFHPVTLEKNSFREQFAELLAALDQFPDHKFIFTGANADTGGQAINQMQNDYNQRHPGQCLVVPSLGYLRYLSAMKYCKAVVGNSSSGVLEAPGFEVPTINIGDRQNGRIRTNSIVDCHSSTESILGAFEKISEKSFQLGLKNMKIPFAIPDTATKIKEILETADLIDILKKKFFDVQFEI
jgi:GDP/UDP-N,N'-diacetylbacillosamine 2-epimerase (hydrolysing)